jgi:hypothetical protein
MKLRPAYFPLLLLSALLPGGCSHQGPSTGNAFSTNAGAESIRVYVTNLNFMDATVWAVSSASRRRLGTVTGKREAVYTVPWDFSTDLWLEIDMLAGGRCRTESLPVDPGDDIEVIIDVNMNGSPLCRGGGG